MLHVNEISIVCFAMLLYYLFIFIAIDQFDLKKGFVFCVDCKSAVLKYISLYQVFFSKNIDVQWLP